MTIYINTDFKCHTVAGDGMTAVEATAFDGKCAAYIEGYRFVPVGKTWTAEDGTAFRGEMISPWKPWAELDGIQRAYEREQAAKYTTAMGELDTAYQEGVDSL